VVLLGLLRHDCSSVDASCSEIVSAGGASWHHYAHDAIGTLMVIPLVALPVVLAHQFGQQDGWESLRLPSLFVSPLLLLLVAILASEVLPSVAGLTQRLLDTLAFGWLAVIGVRLYVITRSQALTG
jgi:hypothetical protein